METKQNTTKLFIAIGILLGLTIVNYIITLTHANRIVKLESNTSESAIFDIQLNMIKQNNLQDSINTKQREINNNFINKFKDSYSQMDILAKDHNRLWTGLNKTATNLLIVTRKVYNYD